MMGENNDIFLAGGDALMYLAGSMHKKYSTAVVWGHPFRTYISWDQLFNPPPPYKHRVTVTAVGCSKKLFETQSHICIEQYDANAICQ